VSDGQVTDDCHTAVSVVSRPGGGSGNGHRTSFRFRLPALSRQLEASFVEGSGRRAYGSKPKRLSLFLLRWVSSHLWLDTSAAFPG
jgi:hypothetical protein